ncbi:uncharacterized protein JCM6883_007451 [Sporobolomyces salmoneus]|uniref:uncharacterized protein n=1 Tax=Sporobolomyces salmoneus TaxID=183962 RepID=UPI00317B3233
MPCQLPVELLRLVVDNFRLPPFTSNLRTLELEKETRTSLYSLSLTTHALNEIAQPLLYEFVRVPSDKYAEMLSLLVGNGRRSDQQSSIRTVAFGLEGTSELADFGTMERLSSEVPKALREVKELISSADFWTLDLFHGSNLSRVFLNHVNLVTTSISHLTFPSVEVLGLYSVYLNSHPLPIESFPALRHLIFDTDEIELDNDEATTLTELHPQLDSIALVADVFHRALPKVSTLPLASILVSLFWYDIREELEAVSTVVNLRLLVTGALNLAMRSTYSSNLDFFASLLKNPNRFIRLQSIYLPTRNSLRGKFHTDEIFNSIENVALAAKDRGVLVVFEEQSDSYDAESQISEGFMRRMTQRRIDGKGEKEK